ncbi:hypothetical protein KY290_021165 [Solanum tuberosum]|uniref:Uncharacterized protein n=1 Tax=Solanum tuberosum TaxID=4113 RepID=A0ABQ7V2S7_SOLTU|nr:hypothetical protein KY289_020343 [Solanum tuberosum]KAH0693001.1 hypothetical protein KY285_020098 [Solanum tuberosum]KAH0757672.1 hypothetical protein KY290_021165 [Solanum tuberosum]
MSKRHGGSLLLQEILKRQKINKKSKYLLLLIMQNMVVTGLVAKSLILNGLQMVQHLFPVATGGWSGEAVVEGGWDAAAAPPAPVGVPEVTPAPAAATGWE